MLKDWRLIQVVPFSVQFPPGEESEKVYTAVVCSQVTELLTAAIRIRSYHRRT